MNTNGSIECGYTWEGYRRCEHVPIPTWECDRPGGHTGAHSHGLPQSRPESPTEAAYQRGYRRGLSEEVTA